MSQALIFTSPIQALFSLGYALIFMVSNLKSPKLGVESYFLFADRYLRQPAGGGGGADEEAHEDHHQHVHRQHGRGGHPHVSR